MKLTALTPDPGHYEWEEFRQTLIAAISEWKANHTLNAREWAYYPG
ncbi:MAG: hypothetical protein QNJ46_10310 [Leptolyngbyaceae cyanobacterium MO_188.B28]|nr:hypothetical protein [Leptolyngbyaceae cyanobacterium MO_188.B28]